MAVEGLGQNGKGIAFLVSAGVMFEIMAAACSSPQTTELNAASRSKTLMKWVNIGTATGALFVGLAALYQPRDAVPILLGGGLAGSLMYVGYIHAKASGLDSDEPPTEQHSADGAGAAIGVIFNDPSSIFEGLAA